MIHTLTLNTAIDMNIFCDPLQPAAVNRTRQTEYCPNGKGVNVSLVLHHYQQPTHVMGIFGGFTGRYIVEELRKQHI
ncbi:TPA: 1-phosphofructokinase, partial [Klebsiella pneumoniae]|nr:1-phosphofructokinase [Klebsiella pneumoniae]HEE3726078.1 1-phosphofructokinase [Klebsiella pneumoniae]